MLKNMMNLNIKPTTEVLEQVVFNVKESKESESFEKLLNVLYKQR